MIVLSFHIKFPDPPGPSGVSKSQQQWAESVGMSPTLLSARVKRRGMTPKEALETPVRQWARKT